MNPKILEILAELRNEKTSLDETIKYLERLAGTRPRRGRPPKWLVEARKKEAQNGSGAKTQ